jgi:sulfide:quinone oxidoreductase
VIALPELLGPSVRGLPRTPGGFIPIDRHARVKSLDKGVFAAGDGTDFGVKHGGVAAQQAVAAAESIAALAGAPVVPRPFAAQLHGLLLGGGSPLELFAAGERDPQPTETAERSRHAKIAAKYLTAFLEHRTPERPLEATQHGSCAEGMS